MSSLLDRSLVKLYEADRFRLEETAQPIITVSGSFREDLKKVAGEQDNNTISDVVFSRAHFSMAIAVLIQAWIAHNPHLLKEHFDPADSHFSREIEKYVKYAWMVDPTNYVSTKEWRKVLFTEFVGKTLARNAILKVVKDFIDRFGRAKLPILASITPPLLYLSERLEKPIICVHIAAGNILAQQGKKVIQLVTDPHVRPEYVTHANLPNVQFCVFDNRTKVEFLETAAIHGIKVDPERIIVTGPPVDPRIIAARAKKAAWRNGPLRLCITTGGLGTNKNEIRQVLKQLLPQLRKRPLPYQLLIYAGTQLDIAEMVTQLARDEHVAIGDFHDQKAHLRLLYHPQILDANELLIQYGFPWADGFITKPSGDMAYDAVAAGCFLLTLSEWGVWEERIREIFEQKDIARRANVQHIAAQLELLCSSSSGQTGMSWVERAMNHAHGIEKLFLQGSVNILRLNAKSD